jgi:opacity protein-like surface antigen
MEPLPLNNFSGKFLRSAVVALALYPALFSPHVHAQNTATESSSVATLPAAPRTEVPKHQVETTISLGATGQLTATRIHDTSTQFVTESLSPSAGLFATFRQSFKPWLGYSVNFGYTRATYRYTSGAPVPFTGITGENFIPNDVYETSISYIAQKHLTGRIALFGEAGAGAMSFASINRDIRSTPGATALTYRSNNFRPEGIAGVGLDYRLAHGLSLRAEYRGLFIKYPDYGSGVTRLATVTSEPVLSVTYNFGKHAKH